MIIQRQMLLDSIGNCTGTELFDYLLLLLYLLHDFTQYATKIVNIFKIVSFRPSELSKLDYSILSL